MIAGSLCRGHGRTGLAGVEDGGTSLLHCRDEDFIEPRVILDNLKWKGGLLMTSQWHCFHAILEQLPPNICFVSGLIVPFKDVFNILKLNLAWVFGSLAGLAIFRTFFKNIRELLKQKKVPPRFELVLLDSKSRVLTITSSWDLLFNLKPHILGKCKNAQFHVNFSFNKITSC